MSGNVMFSIVQTTQKVNNYAVNYTNDSKNQGRLCIKSYGWFKRLGRAMYSITRTIRKVRERLLHIIWWVSPSLTTNQTTGCHWLPRKDGGRLVVTTWLVASLVFMTSYSGILTAMLTLPRVSIPIDSLSDLVSQSRLPWRIEAGSMMFHYFQVK